MTIEITGSGLTIEKVIDVARNRVQVELNKDALKRIVVCRTMLEKKIEAHEIMYGVNTGIGEFFSNKGIDRLSPGRNSGAFQFLK